MTAAPDVPVVRRPSFEWPGDAPACWTPRRPAFACAANAISLLLPHLEPYFVRSIRAVVDQLDPPLAARAQAFVRQEAEHHRQHRRMNRHLTTHYAALSRVDRLAERAYQRVENRQDPSYHVAFAAASETIAYSAARWAASRRQTLFDGAHPDVAALFIWHLAEEVEHKSVAFDVQESLQVPRPTRLRAMLRSLVLVMFFVGLGTTVMLAAERRLTHPLSVLRLSWWAITFAFELLTNLTLSLWPGFHPDQLTDPLWYDVVLDELDHESHRRPPDETS